MSDAYGYHEVDFQIPQSTRFSGKPHGQAPKMPTYSFLVNDNQTVLDHLS